MVECMVNGKIRKNKSEIGWSGCSSTVEMTVRYAFRDFKICATRMDNLIKRKRYILICLRLWMEWRRYKRSSKTNGRVRKEV